MGLIKSNVGYDDDSAFADKEPEENMTYYCNDEEKGCLGENSLKEGQKNPMCQIWILAVQLQ